MAMTESRRMYQNKEVPFDTNQKFLGSYLDDSSAPSSPYTGTSSSAEDTDFNIASPMTTMTAEDMNSAKKHMMSRHILVTGGAGYIGSHTVVELVNEGFIPVVIDNCSNATTLPDEKSGIDFPVSIRRVEQITGHEIEFYKVDLIDKDKLDDVFKLHEFFAVIHFAGLKSVTESVSKPLHYYETNLGATMNLVNCMNKYGVKNLVFSSSATVYGPPQYLPVNESHRVGQGITNPYGKSKYFIEEILNDLSRSDPTWRVVLLRYFNPVGSHSTGLIGEDPQGIPNNLMPFVSQVAIGRRPILSVFGSDYDTEDGTGVRDFIHVVDLAQGHTAALHKIMDMKGCIAINLGTGIGYSVLDAVKAFEKASGKTVPYKFAPRRPGDLANVHADPTLAKIELDWVATKNLDDMCADLWKWQEMNPMGYIPTDKVKSSAEK